MGWHHEPSLWHCSQVNATEHLWWSVKFSCLLAPSHYLSQCWPRTRSMLPCGVIRPQPFNPLRITLQWCQMAAMASQITGVLVVCLTICSGTDQRKHQSSASLPFVREIHRWPVNYLHKGPVTWKMFPFDDLIMIMAKTKWLFIAEITFPN